MPGFREKHRLKGLYGRCVDGMVNGSISIQARYKVQALQDEKMYDEYCKECGVTDPADIDWSNPVIAVAHLLNDPLYRHYIIHGSSKQKKIVFDQMTPEMLDVYYNYEGDNGGRFCDLESRQGRKQCKKRFKKGVKIETIDD